MKALKMRPPFVLPQGIRKRLGEAGEMQKNFRAREN